jgi:putative aldouronate transport system permease protein
MVEDKRTLASTLFDLLNIVFFTLFTISCIFPFYYLFINTISANDLASSGKILLIPREIHFGNYVEVFQLQGLLNATMISILRTVIGTALTVFASAFLGYAFCRLEFWYRKFWYRFVIITMYLNAGLIPWFLTMKELGLLNNFLVYILPTLVGPFYVILFKTYVEQIPPSLEESAQMDGAGYLVRFTQIILPLSMPIVATIAVFASVNQWNSFIDTLFLIRDKDLFTLQFLLYQYLSEVNAIASMLRMDASQASNIDPSKLMSPTSIRMTVTIVVLLPILFVYPFMQRYFVKGIMIGAVKG